MSAAYRNIFLKIICFSVLTASSRAQEHSLIFNLTMGKVNLVPDKLYIEDNDSIIITDLRFYISDVALLTNKKPVYKEKNSYHLLDINNPESLNIVFTLSDNIKCDTLKFNIGIDSITNTKGVHGGELDPVKGMYWTWQSGYINFKMEGTINNKEFHYHLGGYQSPFNSLQSVSLPVKGNKISVQTDVLTLLKELIKINPKGIMSPGKSAVICAEKTASSFRVFNEN